MQHLQALTRRALVLVTGKGGVGKSTVAAVLARFLARAGRRTLALEVDPRESLHRLLGTAPSGGERIRVEGRLELQNVHPVRLLEGMVLERVPLKGMADKLSRSPVFQTFIEGAPGLKELAVLRYVEELVGGKSSGEPVDTVVLDAPASGHGLAWLEAPGVVTDAVRTGPLGRLAGEIARFVGDPEACAVVALGSAEEMPVQELLELTAHMQERLGRRPAFAVVNGLYPPCPPKLQRHPRAELWRRRRAVNEEQLARLAELLPGPRVELPLLPSEAPPALVHALQDLMLSPEPWKEGR
jgi:anion-transporting  ArsA/GET3 family ATPase